MSDPRLCDRCGLEVPPENDSILFSETRRLLMKYGLTVPEVQVPRADLIAVAEVLRTHRTRHLLPVIDGGTVVCGGSPSRAQYLEGQPRDTRPESEPYDDRYTLASQAAFERMQRAVEDNEP